MTPNDDAIGVEGRPETVPLELRLTFAGKTPPLTDHVYGGTPPPADSVCEYGVPTLPSGRDEV
jgi:hypothetical protein